MEEFKQQTGSLGLHFGDFDVMYENDGKPFSGLSGDGKDQYRTAALSLNLGEFGAGFNLFTGKRDQQSYKSEKSGDWDGNVGEVGTYKNGNYGEHYKNGLVNERVTQYRMGAVYFNYKDYRIGTKSEWIRHAIQNVVIHGETSCKILVENSVMLKKRDLGLAFFYCQIFFLTPLFLLYPHFLS